MSLRAKLIVVTLFVALVPLLVSAFTTLRIHQGAFDDSIRTGQRRTVLQAAATVREVHNRVLRQFHKAAQALPWSDLSDPELRGALNLLFQQDDGIAVVALFNQNGDSVVESVFVGPEDESLHPTGSTALRARLYQVSSMQLMAPDLSTLGDPIVGDDGRTVLVPILTSVAGRDGESWTVAFAWSLSSVCQTISAGSDENSTTILAHDDGRILCPGEDAEPLSMLPRAVMDQLASFQGDVDFTYEFDEITYSAVATRPSKEWVLLVEQPRALAQAPSKHMFKQSLFWLGAGLVIAVFAGLFLAQGISSRVQVLAKGAEVLGAGDLSHRVPEAGDDELARLGVAFNHMGSELEVRRQEIEAWNATLQDKVEERTRDLEGAQQLLLESQKLSAMTSLAAGLAHEINNPLTGILGFSQVLSLRFSRKEGSEKTLKNLKSIEEQAQRIREIVTTLQSLAERESGGIAAINVEEFLAGLVRLTSDLSEKEQISVGVTVTEAIPDVAGDASELNLAFAHLLKNALAASKPGENISIRASVLSDDLVKIEIEDTGAGIPKEVLGRVFEPFFTTKQEWGGKGLGLTEAYRIIQQNRGRLELQSEEGVGTTVSVLLPIYRGGAHLV